jgi:hypothetical protein
MKNEHEKFSWRKCENEVDKENFSIESQSDALAGAP